LTLVDGVTEEFVDDANVEVVAVDFAGNVSAPAAIQQAGGCSCSSNDAPVMVTGFLGLGLLSVRRRRRR
jgi:MYXO-CTERM domain-containing protein